MIFGDFSAWTAENLIIRILVSTLLGGIIGLDRGLKHRGAGTKTNTIVCLGATLVMLLEQYIQVNFPGLANMDRLGAQVISGVGFLGVGTIMISNHQVRGLTTAATLWACACVGLSVGIGFLDGGILITIVMLISLHVLPYVERFATKSSRYSSVLFEIEKPGDIHSVIKRIKAEELEIDAMEIMKGKGKSPTSVYMTLRTKGGKKPMSNEEIALIFEKMDEIVTIDII